MNWGSQQPKASPKVVALATPTFMAAEVPANYSETYKKLWNITIFNGLIHYKRPFSIAICMFTSSTAQGGGGSFKNRKPIGAVGCCESGMAERSH